MTAQAAPVPGRQRREHLLLALCVTLLLLATIPPLINLGRYQRRVAGAISRAIGRPVTIGSVSLRLLPWPAFQLNDLTVAEDPAFGAEPALRAPQVIAEPRLSSLWRGRFELARVDLTDASVNLVRSPDGRWSIGTVLLQASHIPNAPTGQRHPGPAPRFPYIEATGTRINVKQGIEKLPYSLLDADFSMWLEQPALWGLKLEGRPVRTDAVLAMSDTGTLRLEGELHRATALGEMPVSLHSTWEGAPIGELSRLLLGRDAGWRGDLDLSAKLSGEIDDLHVETHIAVANLHHEEFTPQQAFRVDATCRAHYSRARAEDDALLCRWPLGDGGFALRHAAASPAGSLELDARQVPARVLAAAIQLARPGAPAADRFHGEMNGALVWEPAARSFSGAMQMSSLSIDGAQTDGSPLVLSTVTATASGGAVPSLLLRADPVSLGIPASPMTLGAELYRGGFALHASGGASLHALLALAAALRLPSLRHITGVEPGPSTAQLAVSMKSPWMDNASGETTRSGTLHLESVAWSPGWLPVRITLPAADATLGPAAIRWSSPSAVIGQGASALHVSGFLSTPLNCIAPAACASAFALVTPRLDLGALPSLSGADEHLLASLLRRLDGTAPAIPAFSGSIRAGLLTAGMVPMRNAVVALSHGPADGPVLKITSMDADLLGGTVRLSGTVALPADGGPKYSLETALAGASAIQAAALWHELWGPGTVSGTARFTASGNNASSLAQSVDGSFHLSWQGGSLRGVLPRFTVWDAAGTLSEQGLHLTQSDLSGTPETVHGTIGWDRSLHLTVDPGTGAPPGAVTGTLAAPVATQ